ncbi:recombinase family protein [Streptomyces sp. BK340]|uniref:recombinase family protein n=1 Tax=Streptomyces sp. BK340 TaxID=2572903 RepID=UPI0011A455DC|nr:recombinase family protein [Streptomyces sp. BK340]TVZ76588.1 DNA invertase Pin-like site-specific DNA recombinase [Streptomyces sp. BK340]
MTEDLVQRAHWGDLEGQNWAVLVRLSLEPDADELTSSAPSATPSARPAEDGPKWRPATGRDIKSRQEQEKDGRRFVESRGGRHVYTYEEPDTSAWKRKRVRQPDGTVAYRVIRPVFEGALEDLKRGTTPDGQRLDGLIVYDIDRLTRDNRHLEDAIEVVENFRRPIIDITGTLDLLTDNGRTVARLLVTVANKSSADTARRVRRKHRALQQAGIPTGSTRPFGYKDDKRTLEPKEAAALRKAVERVLTGASPRTIAADWNKQGITTVLGNRWSKETVKQVLRNPRICGYRSRKVREFNPETGTESVRVETVLDDDGKPVKGQWKPIISVADWKAVTEAIGRNPEPGDAYNARKYLGSGILRCDKNGCGGRLRAMKAPASRKKPEGFFYYTCPDKRSGYGCGGIRISGPDTDEALKMLVIAKYEQEAEEREAMAVPAEWSGEEELARIREDIADWTEQRNQRLVSKERFFAFLSKAEATERRLVKERNEWRRRMLLVQGKPVDLRSEWDNLDFVERRAYVEKTLLTVLVSPAVRPGGPVWNRLTPIYRDED